MNIGEKIKLLRNEKGLTQEELAIKCGLSKNGLWNYENNKRQPKYETLVKIATALDISLFDILEPQETITNKLIKLFNSTICNGCDAENSLELISELADLDIDVLNSTIANNTELSESYLIVMAGRIFKEYPQEFIDFFYKNKDMLGEKLLLLNYCRDLILKYSVETLNILDLDKIRFEVENKSNEIRSKFTDNDDFCLYDIERSIYSNIIEILGLAGPSKSLNYSLEDFSMEELDELGNFMFNSYQLKVNEILQRHNKIN